MSNPRELKKQAELRKLQEDLEFLRGGSDELESLNAAVAQHLKEQTGQSKATRPESARSPSSTSSPFDVSLTDEDLAELNGGYTQYAGNTNGAVSAAHADNAFRQGELTNQSFSDARVRIDPDMPAPTLDHTLGFRVTGVRPPYRQPAAYPPVEPTEKTSVKFVPLDTLPSSFLPYEHKTISIRPFNLAEFKVVADWAVSGHPEYIKNAMSQTIYPIPLNELTIQDGIALMYYHRNLSYPHSPHTMDWECKPVKTASGEWPGCGHKNYTVLRAENVLVTHLTDEHLQFDYAQMHEDFDLPRMSIYEDYVWLQEQLSRYSDYTYRRGIYDTERALVKSGRLRQMTIEEPLLPELDVPHGDLLLYRAAMWLKAGYSLAEKFDILKESGRADWLQIGLQYDRNLIYGVKEQAAVTCQNCGEKRLFALALDAKAFFP